MYIRTKVAPRWRDLGEQILEDEYVDKLNVIEKNHPSDVRECCRKMFDYWLEVASGASWNKLIVALEQIEHNTLVAKIKKDVVKGILM